MGTFGYIGFIGTLFRDYFADSTGKHNSLIDQNCMNMFDYLSTLGFIVRFAIFCMCFASYPLINLILRTSLLNAFWRHREMTKRSLVLLNAAITLIPLTIALFLDEIGSLLAFTGSISGLVLIYTLPVLVHLRRRYIQITNPLLAEAIARNGSGLSSNKDLSRHGGSPRPSMLLSAQGANKSETGEEAAGQGSLLLQAP